ncbi:hypothetical protein GCM10023148_46660 [Actinokineospora soli]
MVSHEAFPRPAVVRPAAVLGYGLAGPGRTLTPARLTRRRHVDHGRVWTQACR